MKIKSVLVLYKKSAYEGFTYAAREGLRVRELYESHKEHYATLKEVKRVLKNSGIPYRMLYRSAKIDVGAHNLIIAVGGDGTFLEAARRATGQVLLGVNSAPRHSVGSFCATDLEGFGAYFKAILKGRVKTKLLNRLAIRINGKLQAYTVLNDILFSHRNPAAMSRYWLKVGARREEQRSSGLWISTAAGSTGAIQSAGGRVLPWESRKIQYWPRELYTWHGWKYRFKGGLLPAGRAIELRSLIRGGKLYLDGAHVSVPFSYGDVLKVSNSPRPLSVFLPTHR